MSVPSSPRARVTPRSRDAKRSSSQWDEVRSDLLSWFDRTGRDLPWRGTRDPYAILVSEVMLQQTRADVVSQRFPRFLERFPTLEQLAGANQEEVLAEWSGLGYYRRARNLHRCAREILELGAFPQFAEELERLPGIGRYTAAAIASFAFDRSNLALDGNVERVLSRLAREKDGMRRAAGRRRLEGVGERLIDRTRPGDSNQALIEIGALLCRPETANCHDCPLGPVCEAYVEGDPTRYPLARRRKPTQSEQWFQVHCRDAAGRILLHRRADSSRILAGAWMLPTLERRDGTEIDPEARRGVDEIAAGLAQRFGGSWKLGELRGSFRHGITNRRIVVRVHDAVWLPTGDAKEAGEVAEAAGFAADRERLSWWAPDQIDRLPTSSVWAKARRICVG